MNTARDQNNCVAFSSYTKTKKKLYKSDPNSGSAKGDRGRGCPLPTFEFRRLYGDLPSKHSHVW